MAHPRITRRHLATAALATGLGAAGAWAWLGRNAAKRPLPAVRLSLLDGRQLDSASLRGQVLLINFWATSCAVCVAEMPALADLHRRLAPQGLHTLAVAMPYDAPARVAQFAEQRQLPFGVVLDLGGQVERALGPVAATPTTLLVDRSGHIVQRIVGQPDFAALEKRLIALLAEPSA